MEWMPSEFEFNFSFQRSVWFPPLVDFHHNRLVDMSNFEIDVDVATNTLCTFELQDQQTDVLHWQLSSSPVNVNKKRKKDF